MFGSTAMISIIIPVLNEERALPATLQHVYSQAGEFEVIVVDGGSTDSTLDIVNQESRIQLHKAATGRASQMNEGARHATGDWLLFLHADTLLPENALISIERLPADIQAGGFKHRFSGQAWGLRLISWLHNFRCRCTRIFYGDQAMFVRRKLFTELGTFPDEPILEDLLFSEKLVKVTQPVILNSYVITESRKFESQGIWLSFWRVILILISHGLHLPIPARKFFSNVR
jgi:rSAM/selenodomain-associated transferase 2